MSHNSQHFSVIRAQWQHIGFSDVHKIRTEKRANENKEEQRIKTNETARMAERELVDQE